MLPKAGSPYHSTSHAVPPHDTVTASLQIMVRGAIAQQGHPVRATLGITDQYGEEYRLKRIVIPTHDARLPKKPLAARIASTLRALPGLRPTAVPAPDVLQIRPPEWLHQGKFEQVDLILNEEKRNYLACGRQRGGLGSLNVGLQSEPNSGWTTVGNAPTLLWDKAAAKPIESPNLTRLVKIHAASGDPEREELENYLVSHLRKGSPCADVGYLIFLALHRMGRTIDALRAARSYLSGDKDYAYSNLLGTLSALVSREHFAIDAALYPQILEALTGDTEPNFRLNEKINLARIQTLDSKFGVETTQQPPRTEMPAGSGASSETVSGSLGAGQGIIQLPKDISGE